MNKLHLNEDVFEGDEIIEEPADNEINDAEQVLPASTMINAMIKGEWDAIDLYNSMLLTLQDWPEAVEVIKDITKEEYVHVGQLEKLLQDRNVSADEIETGKEEAAEEQGLGSMEAEIK